MGTRETYLNILAAHGRRIANRFAYAEMRESTRGSLELRMSELYESVVAMYGDEDHLPVEERSRPDDPLLRFDPLLEFKLYPPLGSRLRLASRIKSTTRDWARDLIGTERSVLNGILRLVTGDERFLAWMETPEGTEWREFDDSLNDADLQALRILLSSASYTPDDELWPVPDSQWADAFLDSRKK